jgi:hypothetical protein
VLSSADFLAPRPCFVEAIPELDLAADLLSQAADGILAGNLELARELLRQADMPVVWAHAARVMGPINPDIHRYRDVPGVPRTVASAGRVKARRPTHHEEIAIFARDGYRCRYCGCRVVLAKARQIMVSAVPESLQWGRLDKDRHAAFYALTAVADHLVPHSRGGTNDPTNLVTTCQACNYGKMDWLIEQVGLIDPRTRPPVCDSWDGLARIRTYDADRAPRAHTRPDVARFLRNGDAISPTCAANTKVSQEEWFARLDRTQALSARLQAFLAECTALGVTWSLNKVLLVRVAAGNTMLDVLGIQDDGRVEIPWYIASYKKKFRLFAEDLAGAISGAMYYETPKMWPVKKKDGRKVHVSELLDAAPAVKAALERLRAELPD